MSSTDPMKGADDAAASAPTPPVALKACDEETVLGHVQCHCSEDDGVPDVGVSVGLGGGSALWIGELLSRDGGDIGLVFHGPEGVRVAAPLWPNCEWQEAADILRHRVAPVLARVATPDAAAMREACAKVGREYAERARQGAATASGLSSERRWQARVDTARMIADDIDALPLASTEAGIGAGEGERIAETANRLAGYMGAEFVPHAKPPAALDEHRADTRNPSQRKLDAMTLSEAVAEVNRVRVHLQHLDYRGCYWDANVLAKLIEFATSPRAAGDRLREALVNARAVLDALRIRGRQAVDLTGAIESCDAALRSDDAEAGNA